MRPESVFPGMRVKYSPSLGHEFEGMVAAKPWQLGGGEWVTKLVDMEEGYAAFTGKSGDKATTVYAASLHAIRVESLATYLWEDFSNQDAEDFGYWWSDEGAALFQKWLAVQREAENAH